MAHAFVLPSALEERGVYVSRHLVNGHRWVYSVDWKGEQVALRCPLNNPDEIQTTIDELWDDLDLIDPTPVCASPPSRPPLRLI